MAMHDLSIILISVAAAGLCFLGCYWEANKESYASLSLAVPATTTAVLAFIIGTVVSKAGGSDLGGFKLGKVIPPGKTVSKLKARAVAPPPTLEHAPLL